MKTGAVTARDKLKNAHNPKLGASSLVAYCATFLDNTLSTCQCDAQRSALSAQL
jgi:hypothetical protein